jgi:hypothetical protein
MVELRGTVNPQGSPTTYHFDYGLTTSYGTSLPVPDASAGSGTTPQPVAAEISGTGPDTHHFRLVATNAGGTTVSPDAAFTPIPPPPPQQPPAVSTGAASYELSDVTSLVTYHFQGTVNPQGLPTSYHFEYGPTTSYGSSVPVPDASAGSGSTDQPVTYTFSASLAFGDWHCRIVATNSAGTTPGNDVSFETPLTRSGRSGQGPR